MRGSRSFPDETLAALDITRHTLWTSAPFVVLSECSVGGSFKAHINSPHTIPEGSEQTWGRRGLQTALRV